MRKWNDVIIHGKSVSNKVIYILAVSRNQCKIILTTKLHCEPPKLVVLTKTELRRA